MKRLWWLLFAASAFAQPSNSPIVLVTTAPTGSCTAGLPNQQVSSTGVQYSCQNGSWGTLSGSFGQLTTRQNSMVGNTYSYGPASGLGVAGGDITSGYRHVMASPVPLNGVCFNPFSTYQAATVELTLPNPILLRASIEYPLGTTAVQATVAGTANQTTQVIQPNTLPQPMCVPTIIPASTSAANFAVRVWWELPNPPTSPAAATSLILGSLATSTTYGYVMTSVEGGVESGPSATFSQATGTGTSLALTWTEPANTTNLYQGHYLYRSSTSSTCASNCFRVSGLIPPGATSYLDQGFIASATAAPTAALRLTFDMNPSPSGDSGTNNQANGGGVTTDITGSTGALAKTALSFTSSRFGGVVTAGDQSSHPIICWGDSNMAGTGIITTTSLASGAYASDNWCNYGITQANAAIPTGSIPYVGANVSNQGPQMYFIMNNPQLNPMHDWLLNNYSQGAQWVTALGEIDLYNNITWPQLAWAEIQAANLVNSKGGKWYAATLGPFTTTTNNFLTVAGQTLNNSTANTATQNYNAWLRANPSGAQVTRQASFNGTMSGTTLTVTCPCTGTIGVGDTVIFSGVNNGQTVQSLGTGTGQAGTYTMSASQTVSTSLQMFSILPCSSASCGTATNVLLGPDVASYIGETNSGGTPTLDGGFWPPATAIGGLQGLVLSGVQTNTAYAVASPTFTANGNSAQMVVMTSGTQNGNTAMVSTGNTTTALTLFANGAARGTGNGTYNGFTGGAAVAGDTFNMMWPATLDGTNPTWFMQHQIGNSFATWIPANLQR